MSAVGNGNGNGPELHDEPRLKVADARKADSLQRRLLREYTPGVWEQLKLKLRDERCDVCGRSLYGHNQQAQTCSPACRSQRHRLKHGAGTPERKLNQRSGLKQKRWTDLVKTQARCALAERTWYELALIDPAYKELKPKRHVVPPANDSLPPHADNRAFVAKWRARHAQPELGENEHQTRDPATAPPITRGHVRIAEELT